MKKRGFTLVELLGVIVILGIVLGLAVVGYVNITESMKRSYYSGQEESILLAAGEYYNYNRDKEPKMFGQAERVSLQELITNGYIEKVLDRKQVECDLENSTIVAYKDSYEKLNYEVCLKCPNDEYETKNVCEKSIEDYGLKVETRVGETSKEYREGSWVNQDVWLIFKTGNDVIRVEVKGAKGSSKSCSLEEKNGIKSCRIKVEVSDTYEIEGYGTSNQKTEKQTKEILIDKKEPSFEIEDPTGLVTIAKRETEKKEIDFGGNGEESVEITNGIKNIKDNESGIEAVRYSLENTNKEKYLTGTIENGRVVFSKTLTRGSWILKVEAYDKAGNKREEKLIYNINQKVERPDNLCENKTYNGRSQTIVKSAPVEMTFDKTTGIDAKSYNITASLKENYVWKTGDRLEGATFQCKIEPKKVTVSWGSTTFTYNGSAQGPTASVATGVSGETMTLTTSKSTSVGSYTSNASCLSVTGGQELCSNYTLDGNTKGYTIGQRTVTITAPTVNSSILTYNGGGQNLLATAGSCSAGGTMYWYSSNPTTSATTPNFNINSGWTKTVPSTTSYKGTNAGNYYIWYYCYVSDTTNNKGTGINTVKSVNKNINKKSTTMSLSATSGTLTYGTNGTITITTDGDGTLSCKSSDTSIATCSINGKTLTITPQAKTADNQKATITVSQTEGNNYLSTSKTYSATVNRKTLTCPSSPSAKTYNGASQGSGISCPSGSTAGGTRSEIDEGSYSQSCTANTGYKFSTACNVSWKINPKSIAVSWGSTVSFTYNGSEQGPTASVATGVNGETMTLTTSKSTSAGSYTSTARCLSVTGGRKNCDNYKLTGNTKNYTIAKKSVAVSWGSNTVFYVDGTSHSPSASVATGVSGESMNVSTTKESTEGKFTSTASCSSVTGDPEKCKNYTLTNTTKNYENKMYYFDVNPDINVASFDIKVLYSNGNVFYQETGVGISNGQPDYWKKTPYNSTIEITNIKYRTGYVYASSSLSIPGASFITQTATTIKLKHNYAQDLALAINSQSQIPMYTAYMDPNGGDGGVWTWQAAYGSGYNIDLKPKPIRTGYTFTGWYSEAAGGRIIQGANTWDIQSDFTFYAHWTPNTYTAYMNPNGGDGGVWTWQSTYLGGYNIDNVTVPTRSGYTFAGWYNDPIGGGRIAGYNVWNVASDFTFYAHWTPVRNPSITCTSSMYRGRTGSITVSGADGATISYGTSDASIITVNDTTLTASSTNTGTSTITVTFAYPETTINRTCSVESKKGVARTNSIDYGTIQGAVNNVSNNGTVKLLVDNSIENAVTVTDKNFVMDLNSKTLTSTGADAFKITGSSTFTLKKGTINGNTIVRSEDSSKITVESGTYTATGADAFKVTGSSTLTLKNGTIKGNTIVRSEGSSIITVENGTYTASGTDNVVFNVAGNSQLTVSGGTITSNASNGIYVGGANSKAIIKGGTITGHIIGVMLHHGTASISNGTIKGETVDGVKIINDASATISGGNINGKNYATYDCSSGSITINGGTFNTISGYGGKGKHYVGSTC